ncbi:hypothetical protein LL912_24455 [Niabella sp. CC-SYL272]|nr:hypothetical protein [Niabella agricola]
MVCDSHSHCLQVFRKKD